MCRFLSCFEIFPFHCPTLYIQKHVTSNKLYGHVSADVQGKQVNYPFLQDSGDFKAAAILGRCVYRTQCKLHLCLTVHHQCR